MGRTCWLTLTSRTIAPPRARCWPRHVSSWCDRSRWRARWLRLAVLKRKSVLVATGIPLEEVAFRLRTWPNDGAWKLLQAGRLIEKKGFQTSLRAFAAFQRKNPAASFTIAGEGPMEEPAAKC